MVEDRGLGLGTAAHLAPALGRPLGILGNILRHVLVTVVLELVKHLLAHPELLELPAGEEVDYLPKDDRRFTKE